MKRIIIIALANIIFSLYTNILFAQFKINQSIDSLSSPNKELLIFFKTYVNSRAQGENFEKFFIKDDSPLTGKNDLQEQWQNFYSSFDENTAKVIGLGKVDDNIFKIKVSLEFGADSTTKDLVYILNFLVYKTNEGYKLGNTLNYNLTKEKYIKREGKYFNYYYPLGTKIKNIPQKRHEELIMKLEDYFGKKLEQKFDYIHCKNCEQLYLMRGIDYFPNMLSTKNNVCGWTYSSDKIMFSAYNGFHKHEILRLLSVFNPKAPLIIVDGITNLTGGSVGKPIRYHIKKLNEYIKLYPEKLDNIEAFWYVDDETNPYFVFHALIVNYLLKTKGDKYFKELLLSENSEKLNIEKFLHKHLDVTNTKNFFLQEINKYAADDTILEFENYF